MDWDLKIFLLVNGQVHTYAYDTLMLWLSRSVLFLAVLFFLILFYKAFVGVKDFRETVFLALAVGLGVLLVDFLLKDLAARPRPFVAIPQTILIGGQPSDFSFPSFHSFLIALLSVLAARKSDKLLLLFLPLSFLVGFSRIYMGLHYPSDVLVGLGLGFLYGLLINVFIDRFLEHKIFKILKFHVE